jgi:hypothetical protein
MPVLDWVTSQGFEVRLYEDGYVIVTRGDERYDFPSLQALREAMEGQADP